MNLNKINFLIFLSILCSIQVNKCAHKSRMPSIKQDRANAQKKHRLNEKLINASKRGNFEEAQEAITEGANVNYRDNNGHTPLTYAAMFNKLNTAKLLIENGADVNAKDSDNNTSPLSYAISRGNLELVKLLLDNNADINIMYPAMDLLLNKTRFMNAFEKAELHAKHADDSEKKQKYIEIANYIRNYKAQREKDIKESSSLFPELIGIIEEYTGYKSAKPESIICD